MSDLVRSEVEAALESQVFIDIALPIEERRHQAHVVGVLKSAARVWLDFPTEEQVEAAAKWIAAGLGEKLHEGPVEDRDWRPTLADLERTKE